MSALKHLKKGTGLTINNQIMSNHIKQNKILACSGGGGCVPVEISSVSADLGEVRVGVPVDFDVVATGSATIVYTLTAGTLPAGLEFDNGNIAGTPTALEEDDTGDFSFTVTATNACGVRTVVFHGTVLAAEAPSLGPTVRWANFTYSDSPATAPVFVETDFTGDNVNYIDEQTASPETLVGFEMAFPASVNARQVAWIDDDLVPNARTYEVGGDPWALDPGDNTYLQALTIAGKTGKVYFGAGQESDYTVSLS